ncbi:MAG: AbrB/MazE/SpoVT family DNA-binding domain-containing protein [Candidatus Firestonebacteria bacterium]
MTATTITTKGQVVIPSEIRRNHKLGAGTRVVFIEREGEIVMKPITREYFENLAGILPGKGKTIKALLKERAADLQKEERR